MKKILMLLLAGLLTGSPVVLFAQTAPDKTQAFTFQNVTLKTVLTELEQKFGVKIFYREEWLGRKLISLDLPKATLTEALTAALAGTEYGFARYDAANIVVLPAASIAAQDQELQIRANSGRNQFDARAQLIGGSKMAPRGQKLTLRGTILNNKTKEPVIGARISIQSLGIGTMTDLDGNYQLIVEAGKYEVVYSALGLETVSKTVQLNNSGTLDINLPEKAVALREVQVLSERKDLNVSGTQMGVNRLDIKEIRKMPALLGEVDVVKSVQMLPGVTSVGEAAAGFNVRGGNTDQNLILLDNVPIFNPTHLFGFFSAFNPDAVQDVTLYRGAIPAQYGGRLSAILDVHHKEGDYRQYHGAGGIGIVSGRMALEGPIIKDKTSFIVAGRSSYSNWIFKLLPDASLRDDRASFYDGMVKVSSMLSDKSKIVFSGYRSQDNFRFSADTTYSWSTTNLSLAWNHIFSEKLVLNAVALTGNYEMNLDFEKTASQARYEGGVNQRGVKLDLTSRSGKQVLSGGISGIYYILNQGGLRPTSKTSFINKQVLPEDKALELALFVQDEIELSSRFSVSAGLRYASYRNFGNGAVYNYQAEKPKNLQTLTDTIFYSNGDVVKLYQGLEPRLSFKFSLNENNSVKGGFARTRQFMHVISNTLTISPVDIWKSSNGHIKPQISDQVSIGYFRNFKQNLIETSVEIYYKQIQDQLDYKDGANLYLNEHLETELIRVEGEAYGIEVSVNKKAGRFSGFASYAYARSWVKAISDFPEERINGGERYPANHDKPHTLNLACNYQLTRRIRLSSNFTYSTGRPFTASPAFYVIENNVVPVYSDRNEYRLPDYHRLDLSLTLLSNLKKDKKWEGSWNLGVYNVYSRNNVYSVFYKHNYGSKVSGYQLSVIGTAVPSLSYNFKF